MAEQPPKAPLLACRRCSDCEGENHHWVEHSDPGEDVGYICKHCPAFAEMCDDCDGALEPGHVCGLDDHGACPHGTFLGYCRECGVEIGRIA